MLSIRSKTNFMVVWKRFFGWNWQDRQFFSKGTFRKIGKRFASSSSHWFPVREKIPDHGDTIPTWTVFYKTPASWNTKKRWVNMSSAYMLGVRNWSLHQFANHSELPWRRHLCMCIYVVEYLFWYHVSSIPCSWGICPGYLVFNFFRI